MRYVLSDGKSETSFQNIHSVSAALRSVCKNNSDFDRVLKLDKLAGNAIITCQGFKLAKYVDDANFKQGQSSKKIPTKVIAENWGLASSIGAMLDMLIYEDSRWMIKFLLDKNDHPRIYVAEFDKTPNVVKHGNNILWQRDANNDIKPFAGFFIKQSLYDILVKLYMDLGFEEYYHILGGKQ
jgi:hypothetical protein